MSLADDTERDKVRANPSPLVQRIASALILLPILVGMAYWSVWSAALAVAIAIVVCLTELYGALSQAGYRPRPLIGVCVGLLLCGAVTFQQFASFDLTMLVLGVSVLMALISELPRRDREGSLLGWALTFAGSYYVAGLFSYYILLRRLETPLHADAWLAALHISPGAAWIFTVMAITWLQDTGAFFVGRAYGRHKMAPYISPKKTWEGAAGGVVAGIIGALLAVPMLGLPISYGAAVFIGAAGAVAGLLGDLAESLLKRQIGVKDAGTLIPGHGGVLDRADSMLFSAPVIYYLILLTVPFS